MAWIKSAILPTPSNVLSPQQTNFVCCSRWGTAFVSIGILGASYYMKRQKDDEIKRRNLGTFHVEPNRSGDDSCQKLHPAESIS